MHGINANTRQVVVLKKHAERLRAKIVFILIQGHSLHLSALITSEMSRQKDPSERSVLNIKHIRMSISVCLCVLLFVRICRSCECLVCVLGIWSVIVLGISGTANNAVNPE